ncbi:mast/stem cell growth factor receptor Kit-like isoform X2 [Hylaeus volcanicus]|uniref:mast/stem cell growth factor receptor Kit-like isoform X2 n=1 Tax=Hylaeus volcanicus TaxID=313075 RepID=UPI0023B863A7|nr:mast/stem cell growth factor receptor Kit-like isoform X2 [Hylaeus volcanicus]
MLTKIRMSLIYSVLIVFYLCSEYYVGSAIKYVGVVQNISVTTLQDNRYVDSNDMYKSFKLNISWLPPDSKRQPSSYSIIVTGAPTKEKTNIIECPEDSIFYRSSNYKHHVLVPENNVPVDMSDLYIRPNCSYRICVIANPRKPMVKPLEILYTVPECMGHKCSCINAKSTLPIPRVNITLREDDVIVNWSTTSDTSNVHSYTISIGVPILTSKNGLPVYNITKLGQVSAEKTVFLWNMKSKNHYTEIRDGYKVAVNAVNDHGCIGTEGNIIVHSVSLHAIETVNRNTRFILFCIISGCILLGILSFILYHNIGACLLHFNNKIRIHTISKCKSQWGEAILWKHNILYIRTKSEEDYKEKADKLHVPFKSIKLIHELGTGHFGKVYLGHIDDANHTLVAVKMSQHVNACTQLEIRQQFIEEIEMMRMAGNHPHLVRLIGYCIQPDKPICILLEYMQGGDLLTYLQYKKKNQTRIIKNDENIPVCLSRPDILENKQYIQKSRHFEPKYINISKEEKNGTENWMDRMEKNQFLKFATEIAMGMKHLEAKGIIHRDLAARNILLNADLTLKISDFGLSRNGPYVIKNSEGKTRHLPLRWMSPEAIRDHSFSSKSDVWSFGVVLWEIGTLGSFPYSNVQDDRLLHYIVSENGRLEQSDGISSDIYKIMHSCWAAEPDNRPNFLQLLSELEILIKLMNLSHVTSNPCYALSI